MRVAVSIEVSAPRELVWEFVTDPTRYLHFMAGMTRFEVVYDEVVSRMQAALDALAAERQLPLVG